MLACSTAVNSSKTVSINQEYVLLQSLSQPRMKIGDVPGNRRLAKRMLLRVYKRSKVVSVRDDDGRG
jgi:hypothetical protein